MMDPPAHSILHFQALPPLEEEEKKEEEEAGKQQGRRWRE